MNSFDRAFESALRSEAIAPRIRCLIENTVRRIEAVFLIVIDELQKEHQERVARLASIWFGERPIRLADAVNMHIEAAILRNKGNLSATAKELGVNRRSLQRRQRRKARLELKKSKAANRRK